MPNSNYKEFVSGKQIRFKDEFDNLESKSEFLYPFQKKIVNFCLRKRRSAIFADCGLGKTPMQLDWANIVPGRVLIIAPLAVGQQTQAEGVKFGIETKYIRTGSDYDGKISITNYHNLSKFDPSDYSAIVLDESSILKNVMGSVRKEIQEFCSGIEYKLACTATPAPNDLVEIATQAEFLEILTHKVIKSLFFINDQESTQQWRLKGHAEKEFWKWVSSWAVACRKPSDIGFEDSGYILPKLDIQQHLSSTAVIPEGQLFAIEAVSLSDQRKVKQQTISKRTEQTLELVKSRPDESWVIWCELNKEGEELEKLIPGSANIKGGDSIDKKERLLKAFATGELKVLISKPSICGFGLNWQHCRNMVFMSVSHSYERFYQAVRRIWRFGQEREVSVHIIGDDTESRIIANIERKERESDKMITKIINYFTDTEGADLSVSRSENEIPPIRRTSNYTIINGDCIESLDEVPDNSVGLSIFSPPFPGMYVYNDDPADVGNCTNIEEMLSHFSYLIKKDKLQRVLMPGRNVAIHITQAINFKHEAGYVGIIDFRGKLIKMMVENDWNFYGEFAIDKNPQLKAIRDRDQKLQFKSLATDSARACPATPDYVLVFKKKGENPVPVKSGAIARYGTLETGWITDEEWIKWAHPIWYDINESDTLSVREARDNKDEKHVCPLQLEVIRRCVLLFTNPGETVLSPFAGIGSEGYVAIQNERKFFGIELKKSYYNQAIKNLEMAKSNNPQLLLLQLESANEHEITPNPQ